MIEKYLSETSARLTFTLLELGLWNPPKRDMEKDMVGAGMGGEHERARAREET